MERHVMQLIDEHGRKIRKLRVSLTDKCNLRCHYCMPIDQKFMPEKNYLTANEYFEIVKELCELGVEEVRLTGGEPLMRRDFPEIINTLSSLPLKKISLTTNAVFLDKYLTLLTDLGIKHLNISLDSLDSQNFNKITFYNNFDRVMKNIEQAANLRFMVKINMVVMKGINDHEIFNFIKLSSDFNVEVRFLELMRIGFACQNQNDQFISANTLIEQIKLRYVLNPITSSLDSTSFSYQTETGAKLGFIASETQPFCGQCSRWRLSADGQLRACLFKDDGISLKNTNAEERVRLYQELLGMKPYLRPLEVNHHMNQIGG